MARQFAVLGNKIAGYALYMSYQQVYLQRYHPRQA